MQRGGRPKRAPCASMMLVVATSILGIPTLLTAEPNLPLYTAADTICDLLRDASDPTRAQYARLLAQNIPVSTPIDYGQEDRANLFQENSPLRCVLITQGGLLRQLCHSYSHLSTFIKKVRLAFNDESQQGGKAGFTVIGANLPCSCLQCLTGDQEQTKAGTGGEKLQEALVDQQQILPNSLHEFTRTDHKGKPYTPHLENVTFREIHTKISNNPTLHQNLERMATIETIVQVALDFPKGFSSYCTISNTVKAIGIGGVASVFVPESGREGFFQKKRCH